MNAVRTLQHRDTEVARKDTDERRNRAQRGDAKRPNATLQLNMHRIALHSAQSPQKVVFAHCAVFPAPSNRGEDELRGESIPEKPTDFTVGSVGNVPEHTRENLHQLCSAKSVG